MGANVLAYEEIKESIAKELKNAGVDTIMLIPPARKVGPRIISSVQRPPRNGGISMSDGCLL
jgi:hypothetical protein